jgi:hypothetical protein
LQQREKTSAVIESVSRKASAGVRYCRENLPRNALVFGCELHNQLQPQRAASAIAWLLRPPRAYRLKATARSSAPLFGPITNTSTVDYT